jgi:hypothetical protein
MNVVPLNFNYNRERKKKMKVPLFLIGALIGLYIMWQCWVAQNWDGFYITAGVMVIYVVWYVWFMVFRSGGGGDDIDRNR